MIQYLIPTVIVATILSSGLAAHADQVSTAVTPSSPTLESTERAGRFRVVNTGDVAGIFQIERHNLMKSELTSYGDLCDKLLFAPRTLRLNPKGFQVVRFLYRGTGSTIPLRCRIKVHATPAKPPVQAKADKVQGGVRFIVNLTFPITLKAEEMK